jgi:hypothetical protein
MFIPVTCEDANVVFDVLDYEADDHDETWLIFEMFASTVGN